MICLSFCRGADIAFGAGVTGSGGGILGVTSSYTLPCEAAVVEDSSLKQEVKELKQVLAFI